MQHRQIRQQAGASGDVQLAVITYAEAAVLLAGVVRAYGLVTSIR